MTTIGSLPILHLSLNRTNPALFADQLRRACHEIGFFLLHHDIPESVCQRALSEIRKFFQRPFGERTTISYENNASFRGYMPLGVENTDGKIDGRDQIEYAAEYNMASYQNQQDAGHRFYHRLRSTNPWPDSIQPDLRPAITEYVTLGLDVADRLRDAMCLALNVDPRELARFFAKSDDEEPNFWSIKLVSYPPISNDSHASSTTQSLQGVGAHTDSNFLTLICQDPNSSGLQVQHVGGAWIDVPPTPPNVFICNIGELSELWTGGYFLATPHRVLRHSSNSHSRTSIPIFYNPKLDSVIEPVNTSDLLWERKGHNQMRRNQNKLMSCVGENSFKSLARSHPKVFARHHGDLRILEDGRIVMR